jgi:FdrA protein
MTVVGQIKKGAYFDSVTLMRVGKELAALPGVADAAIVMGTKSNQAILAASGWLISQFKHASDTDLLIAVKAGTDKAAQSALAAVDALLSKATRKSTTGSEVRPVSLDGALKVLPEANLAMISVAGRYAGDLAMRALESGLHVMLFSDNVALEQEITLKEFARKRGLLVMGPDCGTAIINGVPLAFANAVNRGTIGIVAAAGTGLQEVSCIISNAGAGISQAIGTGGRDVKQEVGGIMFIEGLKALAQDDQTRVILLISKPPHPQVLKRIEKVIKAIRKPVVALFIGAGTSGGGPATLEEAALQAVALSRESSAGVAADVRACCPTAGAPDSSGLPLSKSGGGTSALGASGCSGGLSRLKSALRPLGNTPVSLRHLPCRNSAPTDVGSYAKLAANEAARRKQGQKYVRGLFSGGTFCAEAQIIFKDLLADVYSNAPVHGAKQLRNSLVSQKNTVIDLGEDEFTVGRPHPMIDYSLRNRRIFEEAAAPGTAVILLDVVLGYGSNPDPAAELTPVLRKAARKVAVVCSITGTDQDPQNRSRVEKALRKAGAIVMPSNAAACKLAGRIIQCLGAYRSRSSSSFSGSQKLDNAGSSLRHE